MVYDKAALSYSQTFYSTNSVSSTETASSLSDISITNTSPSSPTLSRNNMQELLSWNDNASTMLNSCIDVDILNYPVKQNLPLPNDADPNIINMETGLVNALKLQRYTHAIDSLETILYSRALKSHYIFPLKSQLTCNELMCFDKIGHTLGIDNTRSYCRILAFDLDCICRTSVVAIHVNESLVRVVCEELKKILAEQFGITEFNYTIFNNKRCGFHIYANIFVSLPTHLHILHRLRGPFTQTSVHIEVPSIMPLPYSAKTSDTIYKPLLDNDNRNSIPLAYFEVCTVTQQTYINNYEISNYNNEHGQAATLKTQSGDKYLNILPNVQLLLKIPQFVNVSRVIFNPTHLYMVQFAEYISNVMAVSTNDHDPVPEFDYNSITNIATREKLMAFMDQFNGMYENEPSRNRVTTQYFVHCCTSFFDGMYMQPFVVALHKAVMPTRQYAKQFNFTDLLTKLFQSKIKSNIVLRTFISRYNIITTNSYKDSWQSILQYMKPFVVYKLDPANSIHTHIAKILESQYGDPIAFQETLSECKRPDAIRRTTDFLNSYMQLLKDFRVVYFNKITSNCFILDSNGAFYNDVELKCTTIPQCLSEYLESGRKLDDVIKQSLPKFRMDNWSVSATPSLISTELGLFNSITGLYTARTSLLTHTKFRRWAVCPDLNLSIASSQMNEQVLKCSEVTEKYVNYLCTELPFLYFHTIIAPALIQLSKIFAIEEHRIKTLFVRMEGLIEVQDNVQINTDISRYLFIVEYMNIDPRFIALLIHIHDHDAPFNLMISYSQFCRKIFSTDRVRVIDWLNKYGEYFESVKYDVNAKSYWEQLKSLDCEIDDFLLMNFVILAACMTKCLMYKNLIEAFKIEFRPVLQYHPNYSNRTIQATNHQEMYNNFMNARDIAFGTDLNDFETQIIDQLFSICMSADFKFDTAIEMLLSTGTLFWNYNSNKKLIILHGEKNTGKSYHCNNLAEMCKPHVVRTSAMSKMINRSNASTDSTLLMVNEMSSLITSEIKTITGNDGESAMKFYKQKMELNESQALIFGATNNDISFEANSCDRTAIDRLHIVYFEGVQCASDQPNASFIQMMTSGKYYQNMLESTSEEFVSALAWMAYITYFKFRRSDYTPFLNIGNPITRDYQNRIYYKSSPIYRMITNAGLIEDKNFRMTTAKMVVAIKNCMTPSSPFTTMQAFKSAFLEANSAFNFSTTKYVNFHFRSFIDSVKYNLAMVDCIGSTIHKSDIQHRINTYLDADDQENAMSYVALTYPPVDGEYWPNKAFKNADVDDYIKKLSDLSIQDSTFVDSEVYSLSEN